MLKLDKLGDAASPWRPCLHFSEVRIRTPIADNIDRFSIEDTAHKNRPALVQLTLGMQCVFLLPLDFPSGSVVKNLPASAGDMGFIPRLERFPGVGNGNPLQYSCLENSMDRGVWWATVHGVAKSQIWLSTCVHTHTHLLPLCCGRQSPENIAQRSQNSSQESWMDDDRVLYTKIFKSLCLY